MFKRETIRLNGKKTRVIDASKVGFTTYGMGIQKGNPKRCLACGRPIRSGESWRRDASTEDRDGYGRIVTIHHSPRCPDQNARNAFQKMLAKRASG